MKSNARALNARDLVLCALFAALIAVGAFIKIPMPWLVLTLQTLFVVLAGLILGSKLGALSAAVYVIAGLAGLPIFTQGGGLGYVLMPTFGYLVSFIGGAWLAGYLAENTRHNILNWILAGAAAIILIYAIGIPYFYLISRFHMGRTLGAEVLLWSFIILPLPGDLISCVAAALIADRIRAFYPNDFTWRVKK